MGGEVRSDARNSWAASSLDLVRAGGDCPWSRPVQDSGRIELNPTCLIELDTPAMTASVTAPMMEAAAEGGGERAGRARRWHRSHAQSCAKQPPGRSCCVLWGAAHRECIASR
jgi:hypothetical protein